MSSSPVDIWLDKQMGSKKGSEAESIAPWMEGLAEEIKALTEAEKTILAADLNVVLSRHKQYGLDEALYVLDAQFSSNRGLYANKETIDKFKKFVVYQLCLKDYPLGSEQALVNLFEKLKLAKFDFYQLAFNPKIKDKEKLIAHLVFIAKNLKDYPISPALIID